MTKKQTMKKWTFTFVLILTASLPVSDWAQSKNALVGIWKLISATDTTEEGQVIRNAYGLNPIGFLTYTPDGRMMAITTNGGRKPLSVADWVGAPVEERAQALATLVAYAGRYSLDGEKVIHHLEAAWVQNAVNMDLIRFIVKLQGNRVTLRTTPFLKGGVRISKRAAYESPNKNWFGSGSIRG